MMKFVALLCFVSLYQIVYTENETLPTAENTTLASSEPQEISSVALSIEELSKPSSSSSAASEPSAESTPPVTESATSAPESVPPSSPAVPTAETAAAVTSLSATNESALPDVVTTSLETIATMSTKSLNKSDTFINSFSNQIRRIMQHYQVAEPVGFPGQTVLPDPLLVPDTTQSVGFGSGDFFNMSVHNLSNFTTQSVNILLDQMKVYVAVRMKVVNVYGNCSIAVLFFSSGGKFNLTLSNVIAEGSVTLEVSPDGTIRANESITDMTYDSLSFQIINRNVSAPVQSTLNAAGFAVVAAIKPHIQRLVNERLIIEVNKQLQDAPKFPAISKMSPVDLAIFEGRKMVRNKYDPYTIDNIIDHDSEYLTVRVGPVKVYGLSKFYRVGEVKLKMSNGTMEIRVRMITGRLRGNYGFEFNFGKVGKSRNGTSKFVMKHLQFEAIVRQPLDLKKKPVLEDLQLETGRVSVQTDGTGNFDYMVELVIELMPDMLRHFIVDALEAPIKQRIQALILDQIDVEKLVMENIALIQGMLNGEKENP